MDTDVPSILLPCAICARTFAPQSLEKHAKICEKSVIKKRKPFDSAKQRIQGTELEEFLPKQENKRPYQEERIGKSKSSWKQTHDEFLQAIRAARGEPTEVPTKQPTNQITSGAPTRANEKGTCSTCNRQFGIKAYDRHVAWCKERSTRLPISPATNLAKERLEARIRYRAPALKNRRPTIREKYMPGSATNLGYAAKNSPPANAIKPRESVSLPNCNKGNDSPAKHKPAARKPGQSNISIPPGPLKSRPMDRVTRLMEDLKSEFSRTRTSSFSSSSKLPVPPLNSRKLINSPVKLNDKCFNSRAIADPISQRQKETLTKSQKLNIVSARSYGNPKLNDITVNSDEFGLMIQPCCLHQEHELVTWKQISKRNLDSEMNLDSKLNLDSEMNLDSKLNLDAKMNLDSKENLISRLNLSNLKNSLDKEEIKKKEKSKMTDICNKFSVNENELFEKESDLDLRTTSWMSKVRKLDQTYLIKDNADENLDTEIFVSETWKSVVDSQNITKDSFERTIDSEILVHGSPRFDEKMSKKEIFVVTPDKRLLEESRGELNSLTRFNDNISFTSTPIANRTNEEFSEEKYENYMNIIVDFKADLYLNMKAEGGDIIENESLSLEDLDSAKWKKNLESRSEFLNFPVVCETGTVGNRKKKKEKIVLENKVESATNLDSSDTEFSLNEKNLNNEEIEFEKKYGKEKKSREGGEEFEEKKDLVLNQPMELSSGKKEELSSEEEKEEEEEEGKLSSEKEEVSSDKSKELSLEEGFELRLDQIKEFPSESIKEISSPRVCDSTIQNTEKKDSSRQRCGTYIIEKPFSRFAKHNRSLEVSSFDFKLEEPLQKRRRTEEDVKSPNFINHDKNPEGKNHSLNSSSSSKIFDSTNEVNMRTDESFREIYDNYVNQKLNDSDFEENRLLDNKTELNLNEGIFEIQFPDLQLSKGNEAEEQEEKKDEEIFTNDVNHKKEIYNSEVLKEKSIDLSILFNETDQFLESTSGKIYNDSEERAEDSLESIVTRTKNLKICEVQNNSDFQIKDEPLISDKKGNINKINFSRHFFLQAEKLKEQENKEERFIDDKEKERKSEEEKLRTENSSEIKDDFKRTNMKKWKNSFIKNNNEKKSLPENKIKTGTFSRSNIPRQISRIESKLNDQFWRKMEKKGKISNFEEKLSTFKNDFHPKKLEGEPENCFAEEAGIKVDSQTQLQPKSFSGRLSTRKETICLSLSENNPSCFQENREENLEKGRDIEKMVNFVEFQSNEKENTFEDNPKVTITIHEADIESKSLSSFKPHQYESIKLNSSEMQKKIRRNMNLLRGSTDTLISSVEEMECISKSPSMVDFFIDETCMIEEIQTPHGSTRYKLLPIIGQDSMKLRENKSVKNNSGRDSYWERASKVLMRRLIGSEMIKDEGEFRLEKRNPRIRNLPAVACSASGKMSGSNKTYDPFLMAEQQMRDLLSDTSDQFSIDGTSNQTCHENSTHYPLTHSSAFVKYPPKILPTPIDSSKKRASLLAPPSEFDDLTSDFSSDCTETNSISRELFVNDLISETRETIGNSTNKEKSPNRDHILGRRVIIDKSKALGSDLDDLSRGRSSICSVEKTRKILEKVSGPKIIRPMVNRSHSVRAASAPKIPERKSSSSSSDSSGYQMKNFKGSKNSDMCLADRSNNNHSSNNSSSYSSTINGSNLSLNSIVSSDVDIKRSNSMFDELMSSFEDDSSTILPSLRSLLKSDPLSMSSPIQSNLKRNGQISDDELSSPDSFKKQDHSKLSVDSAYSSLNRKYYNHGRSTNDMASRLDEDPPARYREGDSRFLSKCKMSKFCHECGSKFPESAKFCCECGIKRLTL